MSAGDTALQCKGLVFSNRLHRPIIHHLRLHAFYDLKYESGHECNLDDVCMGFMYDVYIILGFLEFTPLRKFNTF